MTLKNIVAIQGQTGLFKTLTVTRNSIIVEHIETKKRDTFPSSTQISSLKDISIFTDQEDKPLKEVFANIRNKYDCKQIISHNSEPNKIKEFFAEILPEYDKGRVYVSNMKKVINWYNILAANNLLNLIDDTENDAPSSEEK